MASNVPMTNPDFDPSPSPTATLAVGATSPVAGRLCPSCSQMLVATAVVCPACGTAVGSPKSKGVAVLLAVFLTFWTWVYTYQRDKVKFWSGLALAFLGGVLTLVLIGWVVLFGVWLWAVLDTAMKPETFYRQYGTR